MSSLDLRPARVFGKPIGKCERWTLKYWNASVVATFTAAQSGQAQTKAAYLVERPDIGPCMLQVNNINIHIVPFSRLSVDVKTVR